MDQNFFICDGGSIALPSSALANREDGGHLLVNPPREVWERSELAPLELTLWSLLVAATGRAMLDVLPQLEGGCINYWEAGNWALNDQAEPKGPKKARDHRKVHLHVFGRSRKARDPDWKWGESPKFPDFIDSKTWSAKFERLHREECEAIGTRAKMLLVEKYGMQISHIVQSGCSKVVNR